MIVYFVGFKEARVPRRPLKCEEISCNWNQNVIYRSVSAHHSKSFTVYISLLGGRLYTSVHELCWHWLIKYNSKGQIHNRGTWKGKKSTKTCVTVQNFHRTVRNVVNHLAVTSLGKFYPSQALVERRQKNSWIEGYYLGMHWQGKAFCNFPFCVLKPVLL